MKLKVKTLSFIALFMTIIFLNTTSYVSKETQANDSAHYNEMFYHDGWKFSGGEDVSVTISIPKILSNEQIYASLLNLHTGEVKSLVLSTGKDVTTAFVHINNAGTYLFKAETESGKLITDMISVNYFAETPIEPNKEQFVLL